VLCLDLDRFKAVNDTLGHPIGDGLLRAAAGRLQNCIRSAGSVARLGGDEFVVLLADLPNADDAGSVAQRIIEAIQEPFDLDGHQVNVGASIGVAIAPADGLEVDLLLRNADVALYRAKADGRGNFRFFELAMDAQLQARRLLELDLRRALAEDEFILFYQPQVDAKTEKIVEFEALLRWQHPQRGLISPAEFIPLAEEIGLIVPLGEWVIHQACAQAATWPKDIKVAVNLSPAQFKTQTLPHSVVSALASSGLAPARLELEITESVLLANNDATLATLHQLRSLGISIAMDDFGTGYSSLSYLRSFPFDKIKLDRSFVSELAASEGSLAIVKAVSDLGKSFGMVTTAEGVETAAQFATVRDQGCSQAQGFYFSRPVPAFEIAHLLRQRISIVA
jgi:diguanylate cyclase (GGDEF)-like protein